MGVSSLPKTVTRQRRGRDLNPGPSAPESSTLTTRLPSHPADRPIHRLAERDSRRYLGTSSIVKLCPAVAVQPLVLQHVRLGVLLTL